MRSNLLFLAAALVFLLATSALGEGTLLVQIVTTDGKSIVGQLCKEDGSRIELLNLRTGNTQSFSMEELRSVRKDITEETATSLVGLPSMMAWRIKQVIPGGEIKGSVVKVDAGISYISLGAKHAINPGQELAVYRGSEVLRDPTTGEILGSERRKIARLEVVEVMGDRLCKAKNLGDLEVDLRVGDTVTPAVPQKAIAILPLVNPEGRQTNIGRQVAEELTTTLVNRGVAVVERTLLDKVLVELAVQHVSLFDPKTAQQVGRQVGAYAALIGTVLPKPHAVEVQARLVKVDTGEILVAASQVMTVTRVTVIDTPLSNASSSSSASVNGSRRRTAEGYPLIAGVWREGPPSIRHKVTISQTEGRFTAHLVCYIIDGHDLQPPLEQQMKGTISKNGDISATARNTRVPSDWKGFGVGAIAQTRAGVLDKSGTIVHGAIKHRGEQDSFCDFTWTLERR